MPPWLQAELSNGFSADSHDFYPVVYIEYWSLEATAHSGEVIAVCAVMSKRQSVF